MEENEQFDLQILHNGGIHLAQLLRRFTDRRFCTEKEYRYYPFQNGSILCQSCPRKRAATLPRYDTLSILIPYYSLIDSSNIPFKLERTNFSSLSRSSMRASFSSGNHKKRAFHTRINARGLRSMDDNAHISIS